MFGAKFTRLVFGYGARTIKFNALYILYEWMYVIQVLTNILFAIFVPSIEIYIYAYIYVEIIQTAL